ncbi:MAG TPA: phosphoglycerate dehydrogenase [Terriglobales bacterium]|nr:phosphoglycerate dehydrogenase [Terriglobales bacterium]
MKIVIPEKISPRGIEELQAQPGWRIVTLPPSSANDGSLARELADADALIVRSAVKVTAALLAAAPQLKVVGRAGVGVDNVDLEAATRHGVVVMNTPGGSAASVAELALGMMIALARQLPRADATTRAGQWEKKSLQGNELLGKTLGIVGLGRIGIEVARRARAFEMELIAHDPFVSAMAAREAGARLVELDELLATADYISLHLTLTPKTRNLLNDAAFARMKQGARLINCARGELIDEGALYSALKSGKLAGAALDVFQKEPPGSSDLFTLPNLIATPHIAASTHEAQERVGYRIAEQVRDYLARGIIQNAVNVPSVSYEEYAQLQPWLDLGRRLGAMATQLAEGQPRELSLRYSGELGTWHTDLVRSSVLVGMLNHVISEKANLVNALSLAEQRGLVLRESREENARGMAGTLALLLKTDTQELRVEGSVLHGSRPRLLSFGEADADHITLEAPLEGNLIVLRNEDVPGVVGHVGTVLGRRSINIANFTLGRQEGPAGSGRPKGAAALVQTDLPVPPHVLEDLKQHSAIYYARAVQLLY